VLRVELEEFSQIFTSEQGSTGVVRLRATLVEPTPTGEQLLGQRLFVAQQAATSADAAGGTRALAEATQQAAQALAQWLEQQGR
jgi:cholesterol transport system auxiliary component